MDLQGAVRLLAVDMDGTALREDKTVSPRTRLALQKLIDRDILVVPATGRPVKGLLGKVLDLKGVKYCITSNGARLTDIGRNEDLYRSYLTPETAVKVVKVLQDFDAYVYAHSDDENLHGVDPYGRFYEKFPYMKVKEGGQEDLAAYIAEKQPAIQKIGVLAYDGKSFADILGLKEALPELNITPTGPRNVEFNNKYASKGIALEKLCGFLGIGPAAVAAIGDNGNDLSMLRYAGYRVAMGNGSAEVKAAADEVTLSNDEDGVATFVERYFGL